MMQGQLNMVHFIRVHNIFHISYNTDYEHPESFFLNSKLLGLGRQIGLKFYEAFPPKKLWFLGLKHVTPKCSKNKILAVKNLGSSVHTSVFGVDMYHLITCSSDQVTNPESTNPNLF